MEDHGIKKVNIGRGGAEPPPGPNAEVNNGRKGGVYPHWSGDKWRRETAYGQHKINTLRIPGCRQYAPILSTEQKRLVQTRKKTLCSPIHPLKTVQSTYHVRLKNDLHIDPWQTAWWYSERWHNRRCESSIKIKWGDCPVVSHIHHNDLLNDRTISMEVRWAANVRALIGLEASPSQQ